MAKFNKPHKRTIVQLAILFVVVVVCFYPALGAWFVADDIWQVNFAHNVMHDGHYELIWRNFTSNYLKLPSFGFYRPLLGFTFLFDFLLWKDNAFGYHLTSLCLYITTVYLFFALMRRMTRSWPDSNSSWVAFFSALLFAVSPLHVEDVTWISGRADILAGPFFLLTMVLLVINHQEKRRAPYFIALFCFACALLSNEISIGLPVLAFSYYMIWPEEEQFKELVSRTKPRVVEKTDQPPEDPAKPKKAPSARQVAHMEKEFKKAKRKKKQKVRPEEDKEEEAPSEAAPTVKGETCKTGDDRPSDDITNGASPDAHRWRLSGRLALAYKKTWPFFLVSAIYLVLRIQLLGTLLGGFGGSSGGGLDWPLLLRWFSLNNILRFLLPIPTSLTTSMMIPQWFLSIALVACVCIVVIRLIAQANPTRWLLFVVTWMIISIVPLSELWGLGNGLETSRLLFFFTLSYSALWPVLLFHPPKANSRYSLPREANTNLGITSGLVFMVMTAVLGWATYNSNLIWQTAGHEMQKIKDETVNLAEAEAGNEQSKIVVLGIPKDYKGAHQNFNGSTFHHLLRPPFTEHSLSEKIITFEPFIFGPYELINSSRFRALSRDEQIRGPYVWSRKDLKYHPIAWGGEENLPEELSLPVRASEISKAVGSTWSFDGKGTNEVRGDGITIHNTEDGARLQIDKLNIHPLQYDFLDFDLKGTLKPGDKSALVPMAIGWNSLASDKERLENWSLIAINVAELKNGDHFSIQLSNFFKWYSAGKITSLVIRMFPADTIEVSNIKLVRRDRLIPYAALHDPKPLNTGEYVIKDEKVMFVFDGSKVASARYAEIEVTKPNFFFDNFLMGTRANPVHSTLNVDQNRGVVELQPSLFPKPAYYEVRVRCLDGAKKPAGTWSDPVTLLKIGDGLDTYVY
ncbi:MAG: glycosyltransferase family 39 protein [Candidatus Obscuribacterales bacterium]|nr:glycosyltransferase family 39 protein [Candidatus Obscuribacterales bacterium]